MRHVPAIFVFLGILFSIEYAVAAPWFTDVTGAAGLWYVENRSMAEKMQHRMTGGAAAADFDRDGWVDLFVTRRDDSDLLFRNMGDGTFQDVTASAFGDNLSITQSNGAAWGDIDNDGDPDLYVTAFEEGRYFLYDNNADGTFTEVARPRGAAIESDEPHYGFGVAFGDYDRDGYLDIYTSEWRTVWQTNNDGPTHARLLHNRGTAQPGYFDDVTAAAGVSIDKLHPHGDFAFSPRFSDLDGDGWPDLALVSDFLTSRLFWNNGDGTFTDGTQLAHVGTDRSGMGSTIGDYDGDGDLDVIMTNGMSGGFGERSPGYLDDPTHLWRNDAGVFTEVSAETGVVDTRQGRALLVFDYDRDGDQDVLITNNADGPILYRNDGGNENDWLRVRTEGRRSNRDGVGAWITVTPDLARPDLFLIREIDAGSNFLGQNELTAHFGLGPPSIDPLGDGPRADGVVDSVTIRWPSGRLQQFTDVPRNTTLVAIEPIPEPSALALTQLAAIVTGIMFLRQRCGKVLAFFTVLGSVNE